MRTEIKKIIALKETKQHNTWRDLNSAGASKRVSGRLSVSPAAGCLTKGPEAKSRL